MNTESRTKKSIRNIVIGLSSKIILILLPFINRTIIIWYLGNEYLGLNSLFTSILSVLNLSELGLSFAVVYNMYGFIARDDTDSICALLNFLKNIYIFIGIGISVIGVAIIPFLPRFIEGTYPDDINLVMLYIIYLLQTVSSYCVIGYKSVILSAAQRSDIVNGVQAMCLILQQVFQLMFILLTRNFYLYAIMCPVWTMINNLIIALVSKKIFPEYVPRGRLSMEKKEEIKIQVGGLLADRISVAIRNSTDNIVISSLFGLSILAKYSNYYYIMFSGVYGTLLFLMQAIQASIGDSIARESVEKNYKDFMVINFMFSFVNVVSVTCLFGLYQCFITSWVGEKNLLSDCVMVLFCAYCFVFNVCTPINPYFDGNGLWDKLRRIILGSALANVVLDILLGKVLGISGIIIATICSLIIPYVFCRINCLYKYYFKAYKKVDYYLIQVRAMAILVISCMIMLLLSIIERKLLISGVVLLVVRFLESVFVSISVFILVNIKERELSESIQYIKQHLKHK